MLGSPVFFGLFYPFHPLRTSLCVRIQHICFVLCVLNGNDLNGIAVQFPRMQRGSRLVM